MDNKTNNKSNLDKPIGYLYNQVSKVKGTKYISGTVDGKKVIIFNNTRKEDNKNYDYIVYEKKDFSPPQSKSPPVLIEKKSWPKKTTTVETPDKFKNDEDSAGDANDLI